MATLSVKVLSTSKVRLNVTGLDPNFAYYRYFEFYVDGEWYTDAVTEPGAEELAEPITISGLSAGTRYTFKVKITRYDNGADCGTLTKKATTESEEDSGSFSINTITSSSVKVSITYPNGADYCRVFIYKGNTSVGTSDYLYNKGTYTYSGLSPNTSYRVNVYFYTSNTADTVYYTCTARTFTTDDVSFVWTYAGYKNGILINGSEKVAGYGFYISKTEWDSLIDATIAKLKSRGMYSSTSYPMTYATKGGRFTATMFNQVRYAIGAMVSTGITNKSKGDPILADDLNTLMDCLNQA